MNESHTIIIILSHFYKMGKKKNKVATMWKNENLTKNENFFHFFDRINWKNYYAFWCNNEEETWKCYNEKVCKFYMN